MKMSRYGTGIAIVVLGLIVRVSEASAQTAQLSGTVSPEALTLPTFGDLPATQTLPLLRVAERVSPRLYGRALRGC